MVGNGKQLVPNAFSPSRKRGLKVRLPGASAIAKGVRRIYYGQALVSSLVFGEHPYSS